MMIRKSLLTSASAALFAFSMACGARAADVSLDGDGWRLSFRPQQDGSEWRTVPASVPGDVLVDLERAGVIADPMVGTNVWSLFRLEANEWRYERTFAGVPCRAGERIELRFAGVDTRAEYFLNGERLGASANMFLPVSFDVTDKLKESNALVVRIASPLRDPNDPLGVLGRSRVGGTDVEGIRKAQHMFGWDIMPRLVSGGIWKSVMLATVPETRFADVHWMTFSADPRTRKASVLVDCRIVAPWRHLHRVRLRLALARNGKVAAAKEHVVRFYQTRDSLQVADADLWWPRDAGEPALYEATAELLDEHGAVLARDVRKVGLRTIRWERRDWRSESDPGTFRFLVNGEPIYLHGCDVTPMDALHSRDRLHRQRCQDMLVDLNCNMIRIWGGGVYEDDAYYDFCDANGILVWQDFMMGNVEPEQNDRFAKAIEDEAKFQVMRLRSHPCLAIWCGNNEQDRSVGGSWGAWAPDPEKERISREVLPRVLRDFDPLTPYIPSSPWWTPDVVAGRAKLSQDHLWGPRQLFYTNGYWCANTVTFVSEMGCHGCPNVESLRRMMTAEGLCPWPNAADKHVFNAEWNCKAVSAYPEQGVWASGRNALMSRQVRTMFGDVPDDLAAFSERSQIYQAEALKHWIELFRARKGRTWGLLWWNMRDGWPVLSDGVVDYWFGKKRAYGAIKSVQQPQLVTTADGGRCVAVNDRLYPVKGRVKVTDAESGKVLFDADVEVPANATRVLAERLTSDVRGCLLIDYTFEGVRRTNRCLFGAPPFDYDAYCKWMKR